MNPHDWAAEYARLCQSAPSKALEELPLVLAEISDPTIRSEMYRVAALAARGANDLDRSNRYLEEAQNEARIAGDDGAETAALLTTSYNMFLGGQSDAALTILADLRAPNDPGLAARIAFQRGTILARTGRRAEALSLFQDAGDAADAADDGLLRARVDQNLGMMAAEGGDVVGARSHLLAARSRFADMSLDFEVAFAEHNLGLAEAYVGNLPEAFTYFEQAGEKIRELAGNDFEAKTGHCRALMTAGLFTEAATLAGQAAQQCVDAGLAVDAAEMALLESLAWLESDELGRAEQRALDAADAFAAQDRVGHRAAARLVGLAIQHRRGSGARRGGGSDDSTDQSADGGPSVDDVADTLVDLEDAGSRRDALEAKLLLAEVHAVRGNTTESDMLLKELAPALANAPTDLQLAAATTTATHLLSMGETTAALQAASDGYLLLAEQQVLLGAADLRVGLKQHANRLGEIGLSISLDDSAADHTFAWQERISLATSTPRPVRSDPNPEMRSRLATLRSLDADQEEERRANEDAIRQLDRGSRQTSHRPLQPLDVAQISAALGGSTGVALSVHRGRLLASTLRNGRLQRTELGPVDEVTRLVRAIRADLRRRISAVGPTNTARLDTATSRLDDHLFGPLDIGGEPLVIAVPAELFAVPWGALTSCRNRSTSVVTSLSAWAMTDQAQRSGHGTVMVSGPDLDHGERELAELRAAQQSAAVEITGSSASVETVLATIDGADLAHIVAHGAVRVDNPLFSSLQLADGELSVYELSDLANAPKVVVLSACHVGLAADAPGQELLGMVTGFLNAGTSCVVASTLPVPDNNSTAEMMSRFHKFLSNGSGPAAAWAEVQRTCTDAEQLLDTATFTIFGRG